MLKKLKGIKSFNHYVNLSSPKHKWIDIGSYPKDFLLASPPVYPDFYRISIKYGLEDEKSNGFMYFSSPNQPIEWETSSPWTGYYIQITEDLISNYQHLEYSFLTYGLHEPLYLETEEETIVTQIFENALKEYTKEDFSMNLLIAYCNLLFAHVSKFYERQFGKREEKYNVLVNGFFDLLNSYFDTNNLNIVQPKVTYFAKKLNVTPNYLSDLIKFHTGKPVLEHIHLQIIETAKSRLKSNSHTISEVAYSLGFEYPNYFSRLFRKTTGKSPSSFRNQ